jgi:hypothetical protein
VSSWESGDGDPFDRNPRRRFGRPLSTGGRTGGCGWGEGRAGTRDLSGQMPVQVVILCQLTWPITNYKHGLGGIGGSDAMIQGGKDEKEEEKRERKRQSDKGCGSSRPGFRAARVSSGAGGSETNASGSSRTTVRTWYLGSEVQSSMLIRMC